MSEHLSLLAEAIDRIAAVVPLDDESVKYRLGSQHRADGGSV